MSTVFPSAAPLLVSSTHGSEVLSYPKLKCSARKAGSSLWFRQQPDNYRTNLVNSGQLRIRGSLLLGPVSY